MLISSHFTFDNDDMSRSNMVSSLLHISLSDKLIHLCEPLLVNMCRKGTVQLIYNLIFKFFIPWFVHYGHAKPTQRKNGRVRNLGELLNCCAFRFLKDSRLSKTLNRATPVCAAKCFIANINEFYGRLCSLFRWKCFTEQLKRTHAGKLKSFL